MEIGTLSISQLERLIEYKEKELAIVDSLLDEARSKYGERELVRKRSDLDLVRTRYMDIDITSPHALVFLSMQQGAEKTILKDISRLTNASNDKEKLDEEILKCIDMLNERKKSSTSERK